MIKIIIYELFKNRYKELYVTVKKNKKPYVCAANEKIVFVVRLTSKSEQVIYKELTAAEYDVDLNKYRLVLTSEDTDINPGRYHFDCILFDKDEEKHKIESGRIIVYESYI